MEVDEELFQEIQDLLKSNKENNVKVARCLAKLRDTQLHGRDLLTSHEELSFEKWDPEQAQKIVNLTRELARSYVEVGEAMLLQTAVVEHLNEKIATIKEKLKNG